MAHRKAGLRGIGNIPPFANRDEVLYIAPIIPSIGEDTLDLRDEQTRAAFETVVKSGAIIIGGFWTLLVGSEYLDKQGKALDLANVSLGVASVPTADTSFRLPEQDLPASDDELCFPTGTYIIKNTGKLAIQIEPAILELYEIPTIYIQPGEKTASYSLDKVLEASEPIRREKLGATEVIGEGNSYERAFGYTIRRKEGFSYVLVANAAGGLPENAGIDDDARAIRKFGPNDLRHALQLGAFC